MTSFTLPLLSTSLLASAGGVIGCKLARTASVARARAIASAGASLLLAIVGAVAFDAVEVPFLRDPLLPVVGVDTASALLLPLPAMVAVAVLLLAPRDTLSRSGTVDVLWTLGATTLMFSAGDLGLLTLAWTLAALPLPRLLDGRRDSRRALAGLALSALPAIAATALVVAHAGSVRIWSPETVPLAAHSQQIALVLILVATMARTAIVPFHGWLVRLLDDGFGPLALVLASPLAGLYVLLRFGAILPGAFPRDLPWIAGLGLMSAIAFAILALGQTRQMRTALYLVLSQYGLILMGLGETDDLTVGGTLVLWMSQSIGGTGFLLMALGVEWRRGRISLDRHHGLLRGAPSLAAAYFVFGMSVVGLPGTLTFVAEEILAQGLLIDHPWLASGFLAVTATNAVGFLRLFGRVFLGSWTAESATCADLRPHEKVVAFALAATLLAAGFFPAAILRDRGSWAHDITQREHEVSGARDTR